MYIMQSLKSKRAEIARREGKELYRVFSNETLELTAAACPQNKSELTLIKGWGPKKIAAYGDEILELLKNGSDGMVGLPNIRETPYLGNVSGAPVPREDMIYSVAEFLEAINITLSQMGTVRVRGELSDVSARGGMAFFDLKDAQGNDATAKCYLGRWNFERYNYLLEAGLEVVVTGRASVYKTGALRIVVDKIEPIGAGALATAFEALKKKLEAKGYFDEARKRALPFFIQRIGLVTSAQGEAINDFRKNIGMYGFSIVLVDVRVEGDFAEESIVGAVNRLNREYPDLDVLVLIRGGGGLENLKAFNSEAVAEVIITSRIPVLTGIGHERDDTIAGFASDRNFSTPTAVANFLRDEREALISRMMEYMQDMPRAADRLMEHTVAALSLQATTLEQAFERLLAQYRYAIARQAGSLSNALSRIFNRFHALERTFFSVFARHEQAFERRRHALAVCTHRMAGAVEQAMSASERRLAVLKASLVPLDPTAILKRGYSIAYSESGSVLKDANDVAVGDLFRLRLSKGALESRVEKKTE